MKIELLWFEDCSNHEAAERMVNEVLAEQGLDVPIERIEVPDLHTGNRVVFPGSPTIRVNGVDIEGYIRAKLGQPPALGEDPLCADFGNGGDLALDTAAFVNALLLSGTTQ